MARSYAKSYVSAWAAAGDFVNLTADAQWLYWMLYSHELLSPAGVLPLQPRKWARRAADQSTKRIGTALARLVKDGYLLVDEDSEECLIRTFVRHDKGYRTPNIRTSIRTAISRIESQRLRVAATHELTLALTLDGIEAEGLPEGSPDGSGEGSSQGKRQRSAHRTPPPPTDLRTEDSHPPTSPVGSISEMTSWGRAS